MGVHKSIAKVCLKLLSLTPSLLEFNIPLLRSHCWQEENFQTICSDPALELNREARKKGKKLIPQLIFLDSRENEQALETRNESSEKLKTHLRST